MLACKMDAGTAVETEGGLCIRDIMRDREVYFRRSASLRHERTGDRSRARDDRRSLHPHYEKEKRDREVYFRSRSPRASKLKPLCKRYVFGEMYCARDNGNIENKTR